MELTIIRRNQSHYTVTIVKGEVTQKLLSQDVATLTVHSYTPIDFMVGDRAELLGSWYYINRLPKLEKGNGYTYEVELEGEMYRLRHAQFLLYDNTGMAVESDFSLMGNLEDIARLAISNLNRVYGSGAYLLGDCPQTDTRNHIINNENVLAVLQRVCSDYGYEFELIRAGSVIELRIGTAGTIKSLSLQYGAGKGLYKLDRLMVNDTGIVTRLFVYGGNRNIPSGYRDFSRRLKLPNNPHSYIEDADAIATYGVIEGTKIFEDIYPRRTGVITEVGAPNAFTDSTMDFDLNETDAQGQTKYLIPGNPAKVSFISGNLAGYEFEIAAYNHAAKSFTLKYYTDERGYKYPSADDAFKINVGDQYVLLDIHMPQSYIDAAEAELLSQATSLLAEKKSAKVRYSVEIDPIFAKQECINLNAGDIIRVRDTDLNIDRDIRVVSVKRDLLEPYKMSLELGDEVTVSLATQLLDRTSAIEKVVKINQLHDPAKYRTAWRNALELQQMVFDQDGYFDTGNIKPLSITTQMLSVGSKAGQFVLNGVVFQPGYNGVANRIISTMGTLSHYAIEESIRTWVVEAYDYLIPDNNARYIYIKCELIGSNATVKYSADQLKVDAEAGYYHFLVGVLHSVQDGYRKISLTYGSTTINGKEIKTGRITSQDGQTYFDLDSGEIRGKIVFRSGNDDVTVENNISSAQTTANNAQTTANNAQSTANTALTNANNALTQLTNIASDNILSPIEKQTVKREWDDIVNEKQKILDQAYPYYDVSTTAYTNAYDALNTYITPLLSDLNTDSTIDGPTFRSKFNTYYLERQNLLNSIAEQARRVAKNGGNFLDWQQLQLCNYPITSAAYTNFATGIYGDAAENAIVLAETPFGTMDKVWECNTAAADAGGGGGFSTTRSVRVDPNKSYIFYAWVKILDAGNVTVYYGLTPTSNKVINLNTGSMDSNPYFIAAAYNYKLPQNRWLLLTGIVHSKDYAGSGIGLSGIYDPLTKKRLSFKSDYVEFKWYDANVNSISVRVIRTASNTINSKIQIYGVGIYEMNGQEPSVYSLLSAAKVSTIPVKPSDANLKAFYTFDKNMLFDDSGNGKGLTKYGTRVISQVASDIKGKCLFFDINDTNNGYLYIDDSNYFRIPELTISLWFKFTGFASGQTICGLFSMPYTPRVIIIYSTPTNYARAIVTRTSDSANLTSSAYQIETNRWYHLTFVQKTGASGYSKLYINGNIIDVVLGDIKFGSGTKFMIGTDGNNETGFRFNGYIDELRFYNKALTDEEIAWLYLNPTQGLDYGSLKTIMDGGLVSSGTIQVGQGNDGDYTVKAGMTGVGTDDTSVRFWAGGTFLDRNSAPFRVLQNGSMYATSGFIAGWDILSDKFSRVDGYYEFYINPTGRSIVMAYDGEEKLVLQNDTLPPLSSLLSPSAADYSLGIEKSNFSYEAIGQDVAVASGSILSTETFSVPNSSIKIRQKISLADRCYINGTYWLTNTSGTKLQQIGSFSYAPDPVGYGSIKYYISDNISVNAGTYKVLLEYEITSYFQEYVTIIGDASYDQFSYSQTKYATIIGNNGLTTYWSSNKYFHVSNSETYFIQSKGALQMYSANGSYVFRINDSGFWIGGSYYRLEVNNSMILLKAPKVNLDPVVARTYHPSAYKAVYVDVTSGNVGNMYYIL
ncbi:LamG-like jellyroll fold domain-containing protein [Tenuifilum osseticum]|uniref:LamG-like jellyroll fold domain-containing protein n=1 Tax=Tenuifilum osseticum TaxID=3374723 RepID=UPI0034E3CE8E